jgi:hypothetical protein
MKKALLVCVILLLSACGTESGGPKTVFVFIDNGAKQCEPTGMTPEESAEVLAGAGIEVFSSSCGVMTGKAVATVCGGSTLGILVHEIRKTDLPAAEDLGYADVDTVIDEAEGTGYAVEDCP